MEQPESFFLGTVRGFAAPRNTYVGAQTKMLRRPSGPWNRKLVTETCSPAETSFDATHRCRGACWPRILRASLRAWPTDCSPQQDVVKSNHGSLFAILRSMPNLAPRHPPSRHREADRRPS